MKWKDILRAVIAFLTALLSIIGGSALAASL